MPIYVYAVVNPDGSDGDTLEIEQGFGDPPLTKHPLTGAALRRVITAAGLVTRYPEGEIRRMVSDSQEIAKRGFTRYERDPATGRYHRTAGTDPDAPESFVKPKGNELLPHEDALLHGDGCSCSSCRHKHGH